MTGQKFLQLETLKILGPGVVAFGVATAMGVLMAKLMNVFSKDRKRIQAISYLCTRWGRMWLV